MSQRNNSKVCLPCLLVTLVSRNLQFTSHQNPLVIGTVVPTACLVVGNYNIGPPAGGIFPKTFNKILRMRGGATLNNVRQTAVKINDFPVLLSIFPCYLQTAVKPSLCRVLTEESSLAVLGEEKLEKAVQWSPLVWSTDVRSIHLDGQFLASPERIGHFVNEKARFKVKKTRL